MANGSQYFEILPENMLGASIGGVQFPIIGVSDDVLDYLLEQAELWWQANPPQHLIDEYGSVNAIPPSKMRGWINDYGKALKDYVTTQPNPMGVGLALMADFQEKLDQANIKNEERYQKGLDLLYGNEQAGTKGLIREIQEGVSGLYGTAQEQLGAVREGLLGPSGSIPREYELLRGQNWQNLINRGLTGTTIAPSSQVGITESEQRARAAAESQLAQMNLNLATGLGMQQYTAALPAQLAGLQFIENREDIPPDMAQALALMSVLGMTGLGGGTGAFGSSGLPGYTLDEHGNPVIGGWYGGLPFTPGEQPPGGGGGPPGGGGGPPGGDGDGQVPQIPSWWLGPTGGSFPGPILPPEIIGSFDPFENPMTQMYLNWLNQINQPQGPGGAQGGLNPNQGQLPPIAPPGGVPGGGDGPPGGNGGPPGGNGNIHAWNNPEHTFGQRWGAMVQHIQQGNTNPVLTQQDVDNLWQQAIQDPVFNQWPTPQMIEWPGGAPPQGPQPPAGQQAWLDESLPLSERFAAIMAAQARGEITLEQLQQWSATHAAQPEVPPDGPAIPPWEDPTVSYGDQFLAWQDAFSQGQAPATAFLDWMTRGTTFPPNIPGPGPQPPPTPAWEDPSLSWPNQFMAWQQAFSQGQAPASAFMDWMTRQPSPTTNIPPQPGPPIATVPAWEDPSLSWPNQFMAWQQAWGTTPGIQQGFLDWQQRKPSASLPVGGGSSTVNPIGLRSTLSSGVLPTYLGGRYA